MKWSQASEVGLVRKQNEDSIGIFPELALFAVADGMGGHLAGEVASRLAVKSIFEQIKGIDGRDPRLSLLEGVEEANRRIFEMSGQEEAYRGMGTTLTAGLIRDGKLILVHVGDSRAYLVRNGRIALLTEDHTMVRELMRLGKITREQAREHPQRNILTRALGTNACVKADTAVVELAVGDMVIFCSDGLTGLLEDDRILKLSVRNAGSPDKVVKKLVREALGRGGVDNISVIVVEIDE